MDKKERDYFASKYKVRVESLFVDKIEDLSKRCYLIFSNKEGK